jgi:predicted esterase
MRWLPLFITIVMTISACAHVDTDSNKYRATILFFEGGTGKIYQNDPDQLINRTKYKLSKEGFEIEYMPLSFTNHLDRLTETHFQSIQKKINALKKKGYNHVWLMGISNGTLSVMNAGCNNIIGVEGLIIVNPRHNIHMHLDFRKVTLPILIITHEKDDSNLKHLTTENVKQIFPDSLLPDIIVLSGGHVGKGPQAEYLTQKWQHGLTGLENEFVKSVSDFIAKNQTTSGSIGCLKNTKLAQICDSLY